MDEERRRQWGEEDEEEEAVLAAMRRPHEELKTAPELSKEELLRQLTAQYEHALKQVRVCFMWLCVRFSLQRGFGCINVCLRPQRLAGARRCGLRPQDIIIGVGVSRLSSTIVFLTGGFLQLRIRCTYIKKYPW